MFMWIMVYWKWSVILVSIVLFKTTNGGKNDTETFAFPVLMPGVSPQTNEAYLNRAFLLPEDKTSFIVSFEPKANMTVAHHMLIFACEEVLMGEEQPCIKNARLVYAWARNAPALDLPKDVGFVVGKGTPSKYIVLQIHYADVTPFLSGGTDNSGAILYLTYVPQPKFARIVLTYPLGSINPHSKVYFEATCQVTVNVTFYPFAFRTHTHARGVSVSGYIVKKESNGTMTWQLVGKRDPQLPQYFYPVENKNLVGHMGDYLAARCIFKNTEDRSIYTGPTSKDEMCNYYVMYYVTDNSLPEVASCYKPGPPYRWKYDPDFNGHVPNDDE